ncbi:hypothetical protein VC83_06519 [Pseudogymnoascus destructans]|uniref:Uncharacterized protein n=1 Tax=Pseudogymnoascus destructans TaxID=655981 RepID=A0A177AAV9_9PEZI|nr:uncharacterized protein VC83_06519 [Pseudogymnoascus destructans]OAF58313.1 hypothetical protein VC83_06519 [Pseudogymnoascus destructans]
MGSYKAYLEQGLDLCPKIYLQEDPDPQTQDADYPGRPPDGASQGRQFDYERTASSSNPNHASQGTESARDYIATSSIPIRSSQDTRFALPTPSSNRSHASQDMQVTPDVFSASSSNPTRPNQDTQVTRSIPTSNSSRDSHGDLTTSSNNRTQSTPRSNPLSHLTRPSEPNPLPSQSLNSKDRNPSPPPAPPHPPGPCPPCAKRLWSKVLRAPPPPEPPSPRTPGLWTKVLCSSTTPPLAPDPTEQEAPRPHGLFTKRRRSSVPLLDLPPAELQPKVTEKVRRQERRQSSPMLVSTRTETWPPRRRQRSHDPQSPHHPDPDTQTTLSHFLPRPVHSSSPNPQTPNHAPPSPSPPYPLTTNQYDNDNPSSLLPLQHHLNYTFTSPTLLTQALTPPTPGHSNNARLSYLGRSAMELVLWESCYTLRLSERAAREAVARALGVEALVGAGMRCGLGGCMWMRGWGGVRRVMGGLGVGIGDG